MSKDKGRDLVGNNRSHKKTIRAVSSVEYNSNVASSRWLLVFPMVFIFTVFSAGAVFAEEIDEALASELKNDASHNLRRLKAFKEEQRNNKIFDDEREKGLSLYLEEQERLDLVRERGLREYRKAKRAEVQPEETQDYLEYLEERESEKARYERTRRAQVVTRNKVRQQIRDNVGNLELEELGLVSERPRFSLRQRANNKWVNKSGGGLGGSTASSGFYQPPAPPPQSDFAPPADFPPAPDAFNPGGFDEIQPAVPPPVFDSSMGQTFDGNMPTDFNLPPPPPPPDFDF